MANKVEISEGWIVAANRWWDHAPRAVVGRPSRQHRNEVPERPLLLFAEPTRVRFAPGTPAIGAGTCR